HAHRPGARAHRRGRHRALHRLSRTCRCRMADTERVAPARAGVDTIARMDVTADPAALDAPGELDALAAEYWDTYLETHPLFATAIGDSRYDDILPDPTPQGTALTRARYLALLDRVNALDPRGYHGEDRISLLMLRETIASDRAELAAGLLEWTPDPVEGVPADFLLVPDYQRLETPADGRRMVERWRAMALYTDRHLATLRESLADGRGACRAPGGPTGASLEDLLAGPIR